MNARTHCRNGYDMVRTRALLLAAWMLGCSARVIAPGADGAMDDASPEDANDTLADEPGPDRPGPDAPLDLGADVPDAPDVAPDPRPDVALDAAADARPDVAPDVAPDARADAPDAADVGLDARPDAAPDVAPDRLDATPDTAPDAPPDADAGVACFGGATHPMVTRATGALDPPRAIYPLSTTRVTSQRPRLRWALNPGATGAVAEVCADRACTAVEARLDVAGTEAVPAAALRAGVHFWRLTARAGTALGSTASPTWTFRVRARNAAVDTAWGVGSDFNADGRDDVPVALRDALGSAEAWVVYGASSLAAARVERFSCAGFGAQPVWDVDGDGYGDLAMAGSVFYGAASGLRAAVSTEHRWRPPGAGSEHSTLVTGAGDGDGDGYGDLYAYGVAFSTPPQERFGLRWPGGPNGAPATPAAVSYGADYLITTPWNVGDLDGDRRPDFAFGRGIEMGPSAVEVLRTGAGAAPQRVLSGCSTPYGYARPAGDVDGDGLADFFASVSCSMPPGTNGPYLCRGAASGVACAPFPALSMGVAGVVAVGDVNGDGFDDALDSAAGVLYLGGAGGPVGAPVALRGEGFLVAGDLDGDGYDDIAQSVTSPRALRVYRGGASGPQVASPVTLPLP